MMYLFQAQKSIEMRIELGSNYKTGMQNFTSFAAMKKTGTLIGHGQKKIGDPWFVYHISPKWQEIVEACPHTTKLLCLQILGQKIPFQILPYML